MRAGDRPGAAGQRCVVDRVVAADQCDVDRVVVSRRVAVAAVERDALHTGRRTVIQHAEDIGIGERAAVAAVDRQPFDPHQRDLAAGHAGQRGGAAVVEIQRGRGCGIRLLHRDAVASSVGIAAADGDPTRVQAASRDRHAVVAALQVQCQRLDVCLIDGRTIRDRQIAAAVHRNIVVARRQVQSQRVAHPRRTGQRQCVATAETGVSHADRGCLNRPLIRHAPGPHAVGCRAADRQRAGSRRRDHVYGFQIRIRDAGRHRAGDRVGCGSDGDCRAADGQNVAPFIAVEIDRIGRLSARDLHAGRQAHHVHAASRRADRNAIGGRTPGDLDRIRDGVRAVQVDRHVGHHRACHIRHVHGVRTLAGIRREVLDARKADRGQGRQPDAGGIDVDRLAAGRAVDDDRVTRRAVAVDGDAAGVIVRRDGEGVVAVQSVNCQ